MPRRLSLLLTLLLSLTALLGLAVGPAFAAAADTVKLLKLAFPAAESFTQESNVAALKAKVGPAVDGVQGVFYAYQGGTRIGAVIWTATQGYTQGEPLGVMTGLDADGTIQNAIVFRHHETPGWVDPINNGSYQRQFAGVQLNDKLSLVVNGRKTQRGDIISIANSTISAKGVAVGVSQARKLFAAALLGQLNG